jgi:hypothetical protein
MSHPAYKNFHEKLNSLGLDLHAIIEIRNAVSLVITECYNEGYDDAKAGREPQTESIELTASMEM